MERLFAEVEPFPPGGHPEEEKAINFLAFAWVVALVVVLE